MGLSRQGRMSGKRKYETGRCGLFWCCEAPRHACAVATAEEDLCCISYSTFAKLSASTHARRSSLRHH